MATTSIQLTSEQLHQVTTVGLEELWSKINRFTPRKGSPPNQKKKDLAAINYVQNLLQECK